MKKTVMITGTSSGIGKATALYFHQKGWNVAATMRHPEKEKDLTDSDNLKILQLDVTNIESVRKAINDGIKHFGSIDVLVNNAAYNLTGCFEGGSPEQIQTLYNVDVFGVMNVTHEIIPYFRENKNGVIVNISSLGGLIGMPLGSFYASAKFAIEGFSKSVRFELNKLGIKVKLVEPGAIKTNFADNTIIVRKKDVPSYEETIEKRLAAYEKRRDKLSDPIVVAKVIYKAATDNNYRLRYLAGNDAKLFWRIRKLLPFGMFTALLKRMAG
ncbi:MAG: SDR family oxidoreductase [Melioribacteraceae bacterium]|nr:SDR family oxidoreductase [Melioribacteraceae bacterium]